MTFERQMDETRGATAQITCWCITIALHQEFGVGADRLNRIQNDLEKIQDLYSSGLRYALLSYHPLSLLP